MSIFLVMTQIIYSLKLLTRQQLTLDGMKLCLSTSVPGTKNIRKILFILWFFIEY